VRETLSTRTCTLVFALEDEVFSVRASALGRQLRASNRSGLAWHWWFPRCSGSSSWACSSAGA